MPNAVTAAGSVDHSASVAHKDEFKTEIDPFSAELINSTIYFSNNLDEADIESLDVHESVPDEVKDEYSELFTSDVDELLDMQGFDVEEWDLDGVTIEELEVEADDYELETDEIEAIIEIDSQIKTLADASNAEAPVVEGHVACSAVAACVAAAVVAVVGAVVGGVVGATVAAAVNTTVVTGHY